MEEASIITDLSIVVVSAAVISVLFKILRLPVMLGYILGGLIVGPNLLPEPLVKNFHAIDELKELGVAFLMFYIGLEFDLRKVQKILAPATLAVVLQTVLMVMVGMLTAPLLGWSSINGLFLGCLLAISSTMITIPVLKSQDALKSNFGQVAIGMLILEDILAILVLVVLSGVGVTGKFEWDQAWHVTFLVGVFVVMVFFLGRLAAPSLVKMLHKFGSPEMLTVVSAGLLLGIGELAETFRFSIALGAFLAGSILAQSKLAHEIENAIEPLRSLFTAVFFVTVGMNIKPGLLVDQWLAIVILTLLVLFGKTLTVWLGLFLSGEKSRTAFKAAACKAQIGEFSFVIAGLGLQFNVTDPAIMTLAVGVALGTIIVVPVFSARADDIFDSVGGRVPSGLKEVATFYTSFLNSAKEQLRKSTFINMIKRPMLQILFYFLLFNGVMIVAYLSIGYEQELEFLQNYRGWVAYGVWFAAAVVALPFLFGVIKNLQAIIMIFAEVSISSKASRTYKKGGIPGVFNSVVLCLVILFFGGIYLSYAAPFLPTGLALLAFLGLVVLLSIFFSRYMMKVNARLEEMFMSSFTIDLATSQESKKEQALKAFMKKHPWDISLFDIEVKADSYACGKRIKDLDLRKTVGVSVVGVSRDNYAVYDPEPYTHVFPGDHLIVIGSNEQSKEAKKILAQADETKEYKSGRGKFEIDQVFIPVGAEIAGNTLADANLRRKYHINVIGVQRGQKKIASPAPSELIKPNDILVIVGRKRAIAKFKKIFEQE